ncbi:MAG: tryptophan/tyrosine permease [Legionellales bacterium]|nr:MAG: tryptophan/tyrosine permease [Legionellales bacterium]
MLNRTIGGVLLISGTAIGGGMLAVPTVTATAGFAYASSALLICWIFMTISAFLILEVVLYLVHKKEMQTPINLISMAETTLGRYGKIIAWVTYVALLYALICVYLKTSGAWLSQFLNMTDIFTMSIPNNISSIIIAMLFSIILITGIRGVDYVNRLLSVGMLIAYIVLIVAILPHVQSDLLLRQGSVISLASSMPLLITAFGSAIVVPSLCHYLYYDKKILRITLLLGCLLPLLAYFIWEIVTLGALPLEGAYGLHTLIESGDDGTGIAIALKHITQNSWVTESAIAFSVFAVLTSFLGISLSMLHFFSDALKIYNRTVLILLTYLPPVLLIILFPGSFTTILSFAGIFVAIFLGLLPVAMAWRVRGKISVLLAVTAIFFVAIVLQCLLV